ncbi:DUF1178 family protein [Novosphingobium sp. 1949]|uniref:DUF1178 family protein n=1 Tax=Novosphingobium organovorum TaxID=2930092 RepID=A0ABT0B865_9SPHN|nr:DUF1178 family protein [Novosphingobium organovorum]MCJ2181104.1 DUF1178 family protein [Novosphingobium organovorum]
MIVYDLECRAGGHRFEGWFKSSDDFARQQERSLVVCPFCGACDVGKAIQAPRLARKGNQLPEARAPRSSSALPRPVQAGADGGPVAPVASRELPPQALELIDKLARMQGEALKASRYVGTNFAEDARAMYYGEREAEAIHGETSLEDARELIDEGIALVPLPFPIAPPEDTH